MQLPKSKSKRCPWNHPLSMSRDRRSSKRSSKYDWIRSRFSLANAIHRISAKILGIDIIEATSSFRLCKDGVILSIYNQFPTKFQADRRPPTKTKKVPDEESAISVKLRPYAAEAETESQRPTIHMHIAEIHMHVRTVAQRSRTKMWWYQMGNQKDVTF